jgi:hypothetical protein
MALIFLSYKRTDSPQACRVYDWLVQRFGEDAIFMDVAAIPVAVSYVEFIRAAIKACKLVLALIGPQWLTRVQDPNDPVRTELEIALANRITILPVLVGSTAMPSVDQLPHSVAMVCACPLG